MSATPDVPADVNRTRAAYDDVAVEYAEFAANHLDRQPFDRAMLTAFADLLRANGSGRVLEVGCGPGRIAAHLHSLGLDASGLDLSPRMIELAKQAHPELTFEEGSMERLAHNDGSLEGIVAWYSTIHLPPERLPNVLQEFNRVLRIQGHALLAFQATDTPDAVEAFDHRVVRAYRWAPERLATLLTDAGFTVLAQLVRAPDADERPCPHGYLLASKQR